MRILSVNLGASREVNIKNRLVQTGIYKVPVVGRVRVSRLGLLEDARVEPRKMGLENHAVYAYPYEHYAHWEGELGASHFPMGQFGENLTVTGLLEDQVRIGDVLRVGNAVLQVMQPRIPCAKLNQRMGLRFSPMFLESRKVGYYLRVLQEGDVGQGDRIELLERDPASPTVEEFVRITQFDYWDVQALERILRHARDLMPAWREIIQAKLSRAQGADGWHGPREFKIVRREQENEGIVSLYLQCALGRPLATFQGGQYLTVVLGGRNAHQYRRAYALSGHFQELSTYRITVRHMRASEASRPEGIVSSYLISRQIGDPVLCLAPRGMLTVRQGDADRVPVLLSRGLGIAPVLGILYQLEARKAPMAYVFHESSGHDPKFLLQEVATVLNRNPGYRLIRDTGAEIATPAQQADGQPHLNAELIRARVPWDRSDFYLAGSRRFINRLVGELSAAGVAPTAVHTESFG